MTTHRDLHPFHFHKMQERAPYISLSPCGINSSHNLNSVYHFDIFDTVWVERDGDNWREKRETLPQQTQKANFVIVIIIRSCTLSLKKISSELVRSFGLD